MLKKPGTIIKIAKYIFLLAITVSVLYPVLWVMFSSFKTEADLFTNPWGFPTSFQWDTYVDVIGNYKLHINVMNSILIGVITTVITIILSAMAAYGIMRIPWKGSKLTLSFFLLGIMVPAHAYLVPVYITLLPLNDFLDPRVVLMIPYIAFGFPVSILIFTGYFSTLPRTLEEAAIIDGYSMIGIFFKIILPISMPAVATVGILSFISSWNELLYALIFLRQDEMQTIPVAILRVVGFASTDWSKVLASITITIIPTIIVYIFLQDKIVKGMTAGAIKQ
jgi:raffinose/stachyose/melibiose transport system permease protein